MNIVESIVERGEATTTVRMQCGHLVITQCPTVHPGQSLECPACPGFPNAGSAATPEQLDAITADYVDTMRKAGHVIPEANVAVIRRAAAIQDAWRCAFARVLS